MHCEAPSAHNHTHTMQEDGQQQQQPAEDGQDAPAEADADAPTTANGAPADKEAALAAQQALLERHTNQPANLPLTWLSEEARAQVITAYESQRAPDAPMGQASPTEMAPAAEAAPTAAPAAAPAAVGGAAEAPDVAMEDAPGDAEVKEEVVPAAAPAPDPVPDAAPAPVAAVPALAEEGSLMALLEDD